MALHCGGGTVAAELLGSEELESAKKPARSMRDKSSKCALDAMTSFNLLICCSVRFSLLSTEASDMWFRLNFFFMSGLKAACFRNHEKGFAFMVTQTNGLFGPRYCAHKAITRCSAPSGARRTEIQMEIMCINLFLTSRREACFFNHGGLAFMVKSSMAFSSQDIVHTKQL